jgi:hypothetical protein
MTYERTARRFIFEYSTDEDEEDGEWPADEVCLITEPSENMMVALSNSFHLNRALAEKVVAWMVEHTPCAVYVSRAQGQDFSSEFLISAPEQAKDFKAMWDAAHLGQDPR